MAEQKPTITPNAIYINVMRVHHTRREFFMDFAQAGMEQGVANLIHRIVTTPGHAKAILVALADNVRKYEQQFGEIEPEGPSTTEIQ